jgi:hypothetical protein
MVFRTRPARAIRPLKKDDKLDPLLSRELGTAYVGAKHAELDSNGLWWLSGDLCEF